MVLVVDILKYIHKNLDKKKPLLSKLDLYPTNVTDPLHKIGLLNVSV